MPFFKNCRLRLFKHFNHTTKIALFQALQRLKFKPDVIAYPVHFFKKLGIFLISKTYGENGAGVIFFNSHYQSKFVVFGCAPVRQRQDVRSTCIGVIPG